MDSREAYKQFEEWFDDFYCDYDRKPTSYEIWQAAQIDALNQAASAATGKMVDYVFDKSEATGG